MIHDYQAYILGGGNLIYSWLELSVNVNRKNTNRAIPTRPLRVGCMGDGTNMVVNWWDRVGWCVVFGVIVV
jgi:hypothetical protein